MKNRQKPDDNQLDMLKPAPEADVERLRAATRTLLSGLELAITADCTSDEAQARRSERLFGTKQPLVATLVTLAELLLKLDHASATPETAQPGFELALSAGDVALVQAFVAKLRTT